MQNQLALSGERIVEKIYPQLFHHVGMIRGEYLVREISQNILLKSCQQFVKDYLDTIFIQKMNQMGIECILHYSSIPEIFDLEIDHPDHLKHIKEESKKLQRRTHDTSRNVECLQANQPLYRR